MDPSRHIPKCMAAFVGRLRPNSKAPSNIAQLMKPSFLGFEGRTGWILHGQNALDTDQRTLIQPEGCVLRGLRLCPNTKTPSVIDQQISLDFPYLKAAPDASFVAWHIPKCIAALHKGHCFFRPCGQDTTKAAFVGQLSPNSNRLTNAAVISQI